MALATIVKKSAPWWLKLTTKMFLSRLPISYRFWKRMGVFEHGAMDQPQVCLETFKTHLKLAGLEPAGPDGPVPRSDTNFVVIELGPGDSLYTALVARAYGASRCYLVDEGDFANSDLAPYQAMARFLSDKGYVLPPLHGLQSVNDVIARCGAVYLTRGVASLREIPSSSVDFIFSNAVLEHVRRRAMPELISEMRRCLKPHGRSSHRVDLQDHLGGALNNLRFSERVWESELMARSGFYTNRIRYQEFLELFRRAGFEVEVKRVLRWNRLPIARNKLHRSFRLLSDDELCVYGFDVVLRTTEPD